MPRPYTLNCKRGSYKRYHVASGQCRTPCKKSHGAGYRRSPKGPYYACIKTKPRRTRSRSKSPSQKFRKMYSAGKIVALLRKNSANRKAARAAAAPAALRRSARIRK